MNRHAINYWFRNIVGGLFNISNLYIIESPNIDVVLLMFCCLVTYSTLLLRAEESTNCWHRIITTFWIIFLEIF